MVLLTGIAVLAVGRRDKESSTDAYLSPMTVRNYKFDVFLKPSFPFLAPMPPKHSPGGMPFLVVMLDRVLTARHCDPMV